MLILFPVKMNTFSLCYGKFETFFLNPLVDLRNATTTESVTRRKPPAPASAVLGMAVQ